MRFFRMWESRLCSALIERAKTNNVQRVCVHSFPQCACVCVCCSYITFNAFPRSDPVRGNVVTHLICGPSTTQARLASPHTSCQLNHWSTSVLLPLRRSTVPPPIPVFSLSCRFTRWLEELGPAEKCASAGERQTRARAAQEASAAPCCRRLLLLISHILIVCVAAWPVVSEPPQQRWEGGGRENRGNGARERRRRTAGYRAGGQEKERSQKKTRWLPLPREVNSGARWPACRIQPLTSVILTRRFQHCVLNQCLLCPSLLSSLSFCLSLRMPVFSFDKDQSECDALPEFCSQSDGDMAPTQPAVVQREDRTEGPPRKTFLSAGLYSDDYKTTEWVLFLWTTPWCFSWLFWVFISSLLRPPSQVRKSGSENLEYTHGEHEYSLLPAPIHVGEYRGIPELYYKVYYHWKIECLNQI